MRKKVIWLLASAIISLFVIQKKTWISFAVSLVLFFFFLFLVCKKENANIYGYFIGIIYFVPMNMYIMMNFFRNFLEYETLKSLIFSVTLNIPLFCAEQIIIGLIIRILKNIKKENE